MTEPSLELQKAIRLRLVAHGPLLALVPASAITDSNARQEVFPGINLGEAQVIQGQDIARRRQDVYATLHVWTKEAGTTQAKAIVGEIRAALADGLMASDHFQIVDRWIEQTRFLRDPDGIHAHAVVTLRAAMWEIA